MFTGIIKEIGTIRSLKENESGLAITIDAGSLISSINIDDSVSVNGVCLTATAIDQSHRCFQAQIIHETLRKTAFGMLSGTNAVVNLELALKAGDPMGGHQVSGHVNGVAQVQKIEQIGDNYQVYFSYPQCPEEQEDLTPYFISEGSVAIDGTSLTLARVTDKSLMVSIIPHTWQNTIFSTYSVGHKVNVEIDMMARQVGKLLKNYLKLHK